MTKTTISDISSESERQRVFIEKIREINEEKSQRLGRAQKMFCRTYGCQMNERDSEKIMGILSEMGYVSASGEKDADLVIYNTCCIRENAENKVIGHLGRLKHIKEHNPDLRIALCGCMAQREETWELIKKKRLIVDLLFGTFNFHRLPELLYTNLSTDSRVIDIWKEHCEIIEDMPSIRKYVCKAGVNVMYGCDNFCAYCIVPYVRGRERSREPEEILDEIERLSNDGVKEVMLLGQNVNSYGKNLANPATFAELLRKANGISGIERIRFMTPHPKDFSETLIETVAESPKVCKHIHLPLQSGSTAILTKMNRKYTKERYIALAQSIKKIIPSISITTDIIVGFPGETEDDFGETLDVIEKVRFSSAFTFIYSKRPGTPAAKLAPLDEKLVSRRFERLLKAQERISFEENMRYTGEVVKVLAEEISKKEGKLSGRTDGNALVHFSGSDDMLGKTVNVRITNNRAFFLEGEMES